MIEGLIDGENAAIQKTTFLSGKFEMVKQWVQPEVVRLLRNKDKRPCLCNAYLYPVSNEHVNGGGEKIGCTLLRLNVFKDFLSTLVRPLFVFKDFLSTLVC